MNMILTIHTALHIGPSGPSGGRPTQKSISAERGQWFSRAVRVSFPGMLRTANLLCLLLGGAHAWQHAPVGAPRHTPHVSLHRPRRVLLQGPQQEQPAEEVEPESKVKAKKERATDLQIAPIDVQVLQNQLEQVRELPRVREGLERARGSSRTCSSWFCST